MKYRLILAAALAAASNLVAAQPASHHYRSEVIPGRYIVVFNDSVADPVAQSERLVRNLGGERHHAYRAALKGFAATLSDAAVERLRNDPDVASIEQDEVVRITDVESSPPWGLDRIDQLDGPRDLLYHYNATGAGVYAFIIDTGIRADHVEFAGRVASGYTSVADGRGTNDCHGHGTHVAGTVGGTTYGVAKQVTLVPVRVLGCDGSGTWSGVIAGIDWAAQSPRRPAVANMSLGGTKSSSINTAVANAVTAGITMVVAAGNDNGDACLKSPASAPSAITVGATTTADARASFSNWGACLDVFAPGVGITSAWNTGTTATNTISGTSMATPHVTGVAALVLSANPTASPLAVSDFIVSNATPGRLTSINTGSPNLLVYSLATGTPVEPPPDVVAIRSLTSSVTRAGRTWRAQVNISVRDLTTGANAVGVTVTGQFSPGATVHCVTGRLGNCQITSGPIPATTPTTVFTVTGMTVQPGMFYDASQNSASQITINRR